MTKTAEKERRRARARARRHRRQVLAALLVVLVLALVGTLVVTGNDGGDEDTAASGPGVVAYSDPDAARLAASGSGSTAAERTAS